MAYQFNGSSDYLFVASTPVTGPTWSCCASFYTDALGSNDQSIVGIFDADGYALEGLGIVGTSDVEVGEHYDKYFLVCGSCGERFELGPDHPAGGYLIDEVRYGDAEEDEHGVVRIGAR